MASLIGWFQNRLRSEMQKGFAVLEHDLKMPKYFYHSPCDYSLESRPPLFSTFRTVAEDGLPVPPPECRPGYSPDDDGHYLEWGRSDHDFIIEIINKHLGPREGLEILDWGCSSGRVLRHFYREYRERDWKLHGVEVQAFLVEWMRRNFPQEIDIMCGSTFPHLPFRDSSVDVIYGISVLTHTKYLWDMWLAEFRRVLRTGGLCIQTVQCENAWRFYHENRNLDWVKQSYPITMLEKPEMEDDFYFYGDGFISHTFYKEAAVKRYWGRYMKVMEFLAPPRFHFQNWIVLKNEN